jgi:hypothetical protein
MRWLPDGSERPSQKRGYLNQDLWEQAWKEKEECSRKRAERVQTE